MGTRVGIPCQALKGLRALVQNKDKSFEVLDCLPATLRRAVNGQGWLAAELQYAEGAHVPEGVRVPSDGALHLPELVRTSVDFPGLYRVLLHLEQTGLS
eukprot:875900-Amphidinium_carterae.1